MISDGDSKSYNAIKSLIYEVTSFYVQIKICLMFYLYLYYCNKQAFKFSKKNKY